MNRVTKIGFIVVEDLAKHVVEPLARRVFGPGFLAYAVTFGAKGMLPGAYATALFLLREKSYAHVVLVFDADAGGNTGVDRALEIFVSQNLDLAVAALPEGKDPCDLLVEQGPEPFKQALAEAKDALDFKLKQLLSADTTGVEGRRPVQGDGGNRALDPEQGGRAGGII